MKKALLFLVAGFVLSLATISCEKNCVCTEKRDGAIVGQRQMGKVKTDAECTALEKDFLVPEEVTVTCLLEK